MSASEIGALIAAPAIGRSRWARWTAERTQLVVMIALAAMWVLPVVLMASTSLKTPEQLYRPTELIPNPFALGNYLEVFSKRFPFGHYLLNSMFVSVVTIVGDVMSSAFIAYGFAR